MSYLVLFCSCVFSVLLALRLPRLRKRELILKLFVRLFDCACLVLSVLSCCLGRAAVCDRGTPWTFLLFFCKVSGDLLCLPCPVTSPALKP